MPSLRNILSLITFLPLLAYGQAGSLDLSYGADGYALIDPSPGSNDARSIIMRPDGKTLVSGFAVDPATGDPRGHVTCLMADGTPDPTFGAGGYAFIDLPGQTESLSVLALQPDGKILAAGSARLGVVETQALVCRLLADGTPDPDFGTNGVVQIAAGSLISSFNSIVYLDNGDILLGGYVYVGPGPTEEDDDYDGLLVELLPDGTFDDAFDGDGIVSADLGYGNGGFNSVVVSATGSITAAGYGTISGTLTACLARWGADGSPDPGFNGGSILWYMGHYSIGSLHLLQDGRMLCVNHEADGLSSRFWGLEPSGAFTTGFGVDGIATIDAPGETVLIRSLTVRDDGMIVAVGYTYAPTMVAVAIRLVHNGSMDPAFGDGGIARFPMGNLDRNTQDVCFTADGAILACGVSVTPTLRKGFVLRIVDESSTSIRETGAEAPLLFPNPATEQVHLPSGITAISVFDASGRLVLQQRVDRDRPLDLQGFKPGLYEVQAYDATRKVTWRSRLIKH